MQLNKLGKLSGALAVASQALVSPSVAQAAEVEADWQYDSAFMYYGEDNGRIQAAEGMFSATRTNGDGEVFNYKLTVDALTGASPTGAVPQSSAQTFTRPSGSGAYSVAANSTPLDDTFRDTRLQFNLGWAGAISDQWDYATGFHLSREYDYTSLGTNVDFTKGFNQNNSEFSFGLGVYADQVSPEGKLPIAGSTMALVSSGTFAADFAATRGAASDNKSTTELNFGGSQVMNRHWITALNYSLSRQSGYLTDPFKVVSVVDGSSGNTQRTLYESRPDSRTKHALFWQNKVNLDGPVVDLGLRYFRDDWGISSTTLDMRYNFQFAGGSYIEPHVRIYNQSAADFYLPYLIDGASTPTNFSADYRLGKLSAQTIGVKYGVPVGEDNELSFRLEYYIQTPKNAGFTAPGQLASQELYPEIKSVVFQVGYRF